MNIAILGSGPAGLLAAHACVRRGYQPTIYSKPDSHDTGTVARSEHGGAQYLHKNIPGITRVGDAIRLQYVKLGHRKGYAEKVYGDPNHPVSWDLFREGHVVAWSMRDAYDKLWKEYGNLAQPMVLDHAGVWELTRQHQLVVSSIPLPAICERPDLHAFKKQEIILTPDCKLDARNVIVYNGQLSESWYRTSNIDGYPWTEYSVDADGPPIMGERHYGFKPVSNSCTCLPQVPRLGRFGRWTKQVLSHQAYGDMMSVLDWAENRDES